MEKLLQFVTRASSSTSSSSIHDEDAVEEEWEKALHEFNVIHEGHKALAQVYGEANKKTLVHALYSRLLLHHHPPAPTSSSCFFYRIQAEALLTLRTCLREGIAIEELVTLQAMQDVFLPLASSTHPQAISAQVPVNALRCLMNLVAGGGEEGMRLYHRSNAASTLINVIKGGSLTCVGMELAFRLLYFTSSSSSGVGVVEEKGGEEEAEQEKDLIKILILTLSWVIHHRTPSLPFPCGEGRVGLAKMCLKFLFFAAKKARGGQQDKEEERMMTRQLGQVLIDILLLPHKDALIYQTQLEVINVLMDSPLEWTQMMIDDGGRPGGGGREVLTSLLEIFQVQLEQIAIEKRGNPALVLTPILAILTILAQRHIEARQYIKAFIFPPSSSSSPPLEGTTPPSNQHQQQQDDLRPKDAPAYSLRAQLLSIMQVQEATANRTAAELVYQLSDENANEFVARAGLGNAAGLLKVKGLIDVPEEGGIVGGAGGANKRGGGAD